MLRRRIGPAAAASSYLSIERIIEAALATGAQALHPGYGFLAENSALAAACVDAGIVFVGPPAAVIEAMGDKIRGKGDRRGSGRQGGPRGLRRQGWTMKSWRCRHAASGSLS